MVFWFLWFLVLPKTTEGLASSISLTVDSSTGAYSVAVGGATWFRSEATEVTVAHQTLSTKDNSLKLESAIRGHGSDASGEFESTTLTWHAGAFVTQFRAYADMIVFEQSFPLGIQGSTRNASFPYSLRDDVSTAFPSFSRVPDLGYLAFAGEMTGSGAQHGSGRTADLPTGVIGFGPTCFFTQDLKLSVVLSSFSQFMTASNGKRAKGVVAYGLQGSITEVPPGYSLSFVLAASSSGGVNKAFEEWGDKLLHRYGKSREVTYADFGLQYLSFSTDNGAFYYYQTEGHAPKRGPPYTPGKTYEETLIDVKAYADEKRIPYRYILLDSWWYYQGIGSGVTNWIGRPDVFPNGNDYLRNRTGWPILGHNRYWAVDNVYAKQNGGDYDFVVERKGEGVGFSNFAWPTEQRFWDDLMYNSSKWGLFMYEQDWLDTEYDNMRYLNYNATAARTWLLQMGSAAARNHLTLQYCMSHCRHIMQSVEIPSVTNARASGDYHPGNDQWQPLGTSSIFAWALAIAPTKDNYWSTDVQTGSSYDDHTTVKESYNRLQAAVSTISKGPVAPGDKIGRSDSDLILKSCASDGKLLQGDKPAMLIDAAHLRKAFKKEVIAPEVGGSLIAGPDGEVWATQSVLNGYVFGIVMGAVLRSNYTLSISYDLGMGSGPHVYYEANATSRVSSGSQTIELKACGKWDFQFYAVAPVLPNGWTLLGEPNKWVPVSNARFRDLAFSMSRSPNSTSASVTALGPEGETISVAWLAPKSTEPTVIECIIPKGNTVLIYISTDELNGSCRAPASVLMV